MSSFSEMLRQLVSEKKVKKSDLADSLFVDRSQVYRYLKGDTLPSRDTVDKIARALRLSPMEVLELAQRYDSSITGVNISKQREAVHNIVTKEGYVPKTDSDAAAEKKSSNRTYLSLTHQVNNVLLSLFDVTDGAQNEIFIYGEPNFPKVQEALLSLSEEQLRATRLCHIIRLSKNQNDHENISMLEQLLHFMLFCEDKIPGNYELRYYYDDKAKGNALMMEWFPYLIMNDATALLLSHDYSNGITLTDKTSLKALHSKYERMKHNTWQLTATITGLSNFMENFGDWEAQNRRRMYVYMPDPGIFHCLDHDMLQSLHDTASAAVQPEWHDYIEHMETRLHRRQSRKIPSETHLYFTLEGIKQSLTTGQFAETILPFRFSEDQLVALLETLLRQSDTGSNIRLQLLDDRVFHLSESGLCIVGFEGERVVLWCGKSKTDAPHYYVIEEKSIVHAFDDYFLNMLPERADVACSADESRQQIADLLQEKQAVLVP